MNKKLYLYSQDYPCQNVFTAIMLIYCIALLFLFCPPEKRITGLIIAAAFIIMTLGIRTLVHLYAMKKSPFRFIMLEDENLTFINNNKTQYELLWKNITSVEINYDTGLNPELRRFPEFMINIKTTEKSIKFYIFVQLSAFELVKASIEKKIPVIYNTTDTQKYFEKIIIQL